MGLLMLVGTSVFSELWGGWLGCKRMKMITNARLVGDVLPSKRNIFYALKELINNSIKAGAKYVYINFIPSGEENSISYRKINQIVISDDGECSSWMTAGICILLHSCRPASLDAK